MQLPFYQVLVKEVGLPSYHATAKSCRLLRFVKMVVFFSMYPAAAMAQDDCAALIPPTGAYQIVKSDGSHVQFNTAKEMFCSSQFDQANASNNWGFSAGYGGATVGANGGSSSSSQSKATFCGDSSKDLTVTDKLFLYRVQGDSTLVSGFLDCIKLKNQGYKAYAVTAHSTSHDVTISIDPHLGANGVEYVTSIGLSGAQALSGLDIAPGTKLLPNVPRTATFAFTDDEATIGIHTTTGDASLVVSKCKKHTPAGFATAFGQRTVQVPVTETWTWTINVPQASCHPHCGYDRGDEQQITLQPAGNGDTLSNVTYTGCSGNGCQFDDHISVGLANASTPTFHIRSRSESVVATVTAVGTHTVPQNQWVQLMSGTQVLYDEPFSVWLPADIQSPSLRFNGLSVPLSGLASGPWNGTSLDVIDPGSGGSVTFKVSAPSCDFST